MSAEWEKLWAALPDRVDHPYRVAIIEALWWIGEPLSAIGLVDVLDGYMSMSEAAIHLAALERLGVVEPLPAARVTQAGEDRFDTPYGLKAPDVAG